MIKLCPNCLKQYNSPQGLAHLAEIKAMKQNLYCIHTYKTEKHFVN